MSAGPPIDRLLGEILHLASGVLSRTAMSAEWDHPLIGSWGNSPLSIRGAKTLIKRPRRVEYTTLKCITEADSRPLLRQWLPCTRVLLHITLASLGICHWRICSAGPKLFPLQPVRPALPCKRLMAPLPMVLFSGPVGWGSGTQVCFPPLVTMCVCIFQIRVWVGH